MQSCQLGRSSISINGPLAFGGNVFGWTADAATSFRLLDAFVDAGGNFIDTANVYSAWVPGHGGGESESIIGQWLRQSGKRSKVVIATKVGMQMGDGGQGLSRAYILKEAEASLRRLGVETIDLYQSHKDDEKTPQQETLEAYADLIKQGKVREIGASNFSAARLAEALQISQQHGLPRYQSLQPNYSLVEREFEHELQPLCQRENIGVISYFSLASGFLTGKYRSKADVSGKARGSRVEKYFSSPQGPRVLAALDAVSKRLNTKPARVALAWLMAQPAVTAPIASATRIDQLQDLLAACDLKLDSAAMQELDAASA